MNSEEAFISQQCKNSACNLKKKEHAEKGEY